MKTTRFPFKSALIAVLVLAGALPSPAELPMLKAPWLGFFAAFANKRYQFTIDAFAKMSLTPLNDKGDPASRHLSIPLEIVIEERQATGKTIQRQIDPATLESPQAPTPNLEKLVIRGKAKGGAAFELTLEQSRGQISASGKLLDTGANHNPPRFALRFKMPSAYPYDKRTDKDKLKAFDKKIKNDRIDLRLTDNSRKKQSFDQPVAAASLNGPGVASAEIDVEAYKGKKILISATPPSSLTLANPATAPLHEGYTILWQVDPAKDPQAKARLTFEVK